MISMQAQIQKMRSEMSEIHATQYLAKRKELSQAHMTGMRDMMNMMMQAT